MGILRAISIASLSFFSLIFISCGGGEKGSGSFVKLQGAGASFPAPLYTKWFKDYGSSHQNIQNDFQSVGSGSGVKSYTSKASTR